MSSSRGSSDSGIEPVSLMSPGLAGGFFTTGATWKPLSVIHICTFITHFIILYTFILLFYTLFSWVPKSLQMVTTAMKLKDHCSL